jgi:hypothetical protein
VSVDLAFPRADHLRFARKTDINPAELCDSF